MRKTEEGSRTLVYAAQGGPETHGQYLDDCKVGPYVIAPNMLEQVR
jgi:retinol dehydrogenase 12